jgi:hypothetical protein
VEERYLPGRKSERFVAEDPVQFMVAVNPRLLTSKISNCSQEGICFETELNLRPGTVIFVAAGSDARYYRAQVKWTEQIEREGTGRFAVGAEYLDTP